METITVRRPNFFSAHRKKNWRWATLLFLLLVILPPAWSDIRSASSANQSKKLCYCDCESKHHGKMCTDMCELPKYESRWWAVSCLKKLSDAFAPSGSTEHSHSKKTNRTENARL